MVLYNKDGRLKLCWAINTNHSPVLLIGSQLSSVLSPLIFYGMISPHEPQLSQENSFIKPGIGKNWTSHNIRTPGGLKFKLTIVKKVKDYLLHWNICPIASEFSLICIKIRNTRQYNQLRPAKNVKHTTWQGTEWSLVIFLSNYRLQLLMRVISQEWKYEAKTSSSSPRVLYILICVPWTVNWAFN